MLKNRKCPVCADHEAELLYDRGRGKSFNTLICKKCGMVYVSELPQEEGGYRKHDSDQLTPEVIDKVLSAEKRAREMARRRFENIQKNASYMLSSEGRMHDIGASVGFFMECWAEQGFSVTGCEPDSYYASIAREHFGYDMVPCFYEDRPLEEASFDVVTMCHVLEHCPDPRMVLKKVRKELKSSGLLYIEIPHIDRPYSGNLDRFFWREHVNYFSINTLDALLRSEGFKIRTSGGLGFFLWAVAEVGPYDEISNDLPFDEPADIKQRTMIARSRFHDKKITDLEKKIAQLEDTLAKLEPSLAEKSD